MIPAFLATLLPLAFKSIPSSGTTLVSAPFYHEFQIFKLFANGFNLGVADLVVATAGDDKKITLWRKNGQTLGTIGTDAADNIEVSIFLCPFCRIYTFILATLATSYQNVIIP